MSVLENLTVQGFEGYKKADVLFSQGLNLITGRNSTGKTTLLDAIFFTLYGEVPGIDKKLLVSRLQGASRSLYTSLKFRSQRGELVEIRRWGRVTVSRGRESYHKEKELLLVNGKQVHVSGEEDLRRKVKGFLGLSMKKFLNLAYIRQGELTRILEPRKEDMDSILGITVLRELREQLDQARKELEKYEGQDVVTLVTILENERIPGLKGEIGSLEEQIKTLKSEVEKLKETLEKAESPQFTQLIEFISKRDSLHEKIKAEKAGLKTNLQSVNVLTPEELDKKLTESSQQLKELEELLNSAKQKFEEVKAKKNGIEALLKQAKDENEKHKELLEKGKGVCPTCGQQITPETMEKVLKEDEKKIMGYEKELGKLNELFRQAEEDFNNLNGKFQSLERDVKLMENAKKNIDEQLKNISNLTKQANETIQKIKSLLKVLNLPLEPEDEDLKAKVAE